MQKLTNSTEILKSISITKKLTGKRLIHAFNAIPKISAIRSPQGFDDSNDIHSMLLTLTDTERTELDVAVPSLTRCPAPPTPTPQPSCLVRVHAILCANDDGSGGAADPNAVDANYIKQLIATTSVIYQHVGIQFVYDPAHDFEQINSSLLNLDFTVPSNLNFNLPESQPPLTETEIQDLGKPHADERQRIGKQYRHKMVLLFCDGNMLSYDKKNKLWIIITRTYAFSGGDAEFVALPTGKGDLQGFANLVAHETGHYFHQPHTHGWMPKNIKEAGRLIKDFVEKGNHSLEDGLTVFDGDGYKDTPPDAGNDLFNNEYGAGGDCASQDNVLIPVTFSNGVQKDYSLNPDRGNVMSYFKHCLNFKMRFSQEQITGIQKSIEEKNRWHLCNPSMRLGLLGAYVL
ncbi:MAG: hypothetical protein D3923_02610, partial [Candidatus Electrothrix sp. AR3]|nr:hypothetical protein [Candidatus Electrothrix sp. AR3]